MACTVEALKCFGEIYKILENLNHSANNTVTGNVPMTAETLLLLNSAIEADLIPSQTVHFNKDHIDICKFGDKLVLQNAYVEIIVSVPSHVYTTWDELLSKENNRIAIPKHFLIIEDDYRIYSEHSENKLVASYKTAINLIGYLKDAADHENGKTSFVYLGNSKLTIDLNYDRKSLDSVNTYGFNVFTEMMQDKEHSKQKKYILQEVLFNMLLQVSEFERFKSLLNRLQDFVMQCEHGYRLFVTSFSFDSVRREYEEKYRDYNSKLNSSINDVATKALATPVTLLFSISNINATSTNVSNYAIAISSILVSTLMLYLVRSNSDNLQAIQDEYTKLFQRLALEFNTNITGEPGNKNDVAKLKTKLDNRVSASQDLNKLTIVSAIASSIFVIGYMFWLTW